MSAKSFPFSNARRSPDPATGGARLELKPASDGPTGFVDGGWWPRTRELPAELPELQAVLADRLGPIERVSYRLSDWEQAERRIVVDGALVHLGGYLGRPVGTVDVIAASGRVTLLVVPPDTAPGAAHRALGAAAQPGNADRVADLLAPDPGGAAEQAAVGPGTRDA
jgi:hypothetical protein